MAIKSVIISGLRKSMREELKAAATYKARMPHADAKTANLYAHIINEEMQHFREFKKRLEEVAKM